MLLRVEETELKTEEKEERMGRGGKAEAHTNLMLHTAKIPPGTVGYNTDSSVF